jgi:NAD+ synthase (glutamine-hydrolysing)
MKITLAQINTVVGDIDGNLRKVVDTVNSVASAGTDLVVFPEMCLSGYPPKDLVERPLFLAQSLDALKSVEQLSRSCPETGIVVGLPQRANRTGKGVVNVAALVTGGKTVFVQQKSLLPTYDVFDEARYFDPAENIETAGFKGQSLGLSICEDAWNDPDLFSRRPYDTDPVAILAEKGATVMINISASPFTVGKEGFRLELVRHHAMRYNVPFVLVNQVGGNDELVFDGRSYCVGAGGELLAALPMFEEAVVTVDTGTGGETVPFVPMEETESIYRALVLGTRDYFHKCGFEKAVVGLSGGIDSAVTLSVAVSALGRENVLAVTMPSPHSSRGSVEDSGKLAQNLGVRMDVLSIGDLMETYDKTLSGVFESDVTGVARENVQARIRGNLLMAYSNTFGNLVLSTGNKTELAVGYCTLYGDMSGGLAVLSDVPKMTVYKLAEFVNKDGEILPRAIIDKPPSAELRPGQTDQDTLPPYETLDAILDLYVEEGLSVPDIAGRGFDETMVRWVVDNVRKNEYKRRQAAPGLKVTSKAFGVGRRFPIAARYDV